jgi:hypothetical protein
MDVLYVKAHYAYSYCKRTAPAMKRGLFSCVRLGETSTDIVPFDVHKSTLLSDKLVEVPRDLEQEANTRKAQPAKKDKVAMRHEQVIRKHLSTNVQPPKVIEWLEMRDPETHKVYYHNKVTGKSVWSKPEGFDEAIELCTQADDTRTTFWIEVQDSKGRVYYYDLLTRETRWDRPANYDDAYVQEELLLRTNTDRPLSPRQMMKLAQLQVM